MVISSESTLLELAGMMADMDLEVMCVESI